MKLQQTLLPLALGGVLATQAAQMTDLFDARPKASGTAVIFTGDTTSAGLEPGETSGMHGNKRDHTVWAEWTAPENGWVKVDTLGTSFANAMFAVYGGNQIDRLAPVARGFDPDGSGPNPAQVRFPVAKGTAYAIVVDSTTDASSGDGPLTLNLSLTPDAGPGSVIITDSFSQRNTLVGGSGWLIGNTRSFTLDPYEPDDYDVAGRTAWCSWTAPATGEATLSTLSSDFDTLLTAFAGATDPGDPFSRLDEVAANDNIPNDPLKRSLVRFQCEAGRTYQIMVGGGNSYSSGYGNVVLELNLEPNFKPGGTVGSDRFADRGLLVGFSANGVGNNQSATKEAFEPEPPGNGRTYWWQWTAPANGPVLVDTFGSKGDTVLAVSTGSQLSSLTRIAYNRDAGGTSASQVAFLAQRGQVYQIVVDAESSLSSARGNIVLNVNQQNPDPLPGMAVYTGTEIEVYAQRGKLYQLQVSTDFLRWEDWGAAFAGEDQPVRFFDSTRANGRRFYRYVTR